MEMVACMIAKMKGSRKGRQDLTRIVGRGSSGSGVHVWRESQMADEFFF